MEELTDYLGLYSRLSSSEQVNVDRQQRRKTMTDVSSKLMEAKSMKYAALRWFASLPLHSRRSIMTVSSKAWTQMVLRMASQLRTSGQGSFFVLDEMSDNEELVLLPFRSSNKCKSATARKSVCDTSQRNPSLQQQLRLPKVCFKEATGLFARLHEQQEAAALLESSLRFLSSQAYSRQGITIDRESQYYAEHREGFNWLHMDTVTLSDEILSDCNRLFHVLDVLSWGGFLTSDTTTLPASTRCKDPNKRSSSALSGGRRGMGEGGMKGTAIASASGREGWRECSEETWEELPWLKSLGFYSLAAFVTNQLELCLRRKWAEHRKEVGTHGSAGRENGRGNISTERNGTAGDRRLRVTSRVHECMDAVVTWCNTLDGKTGQRLMEAVHVAAVVAEVSIRTKVTAHRMGGSQ